MRPTARHLVTCNGGVKQIFPRPAEPFEDAERKLGIAVLDFRVLRIGPVGQKADAITFDSEARAERSATLLYVQVGIVKDRSSRVPELRRSPARPWQTVIIPADFGIVLRRPQGDQIEFCLVLHVGFESLG